MNNNQKLDETIKIDLPRSKKYGIQPPIIERILVIPAKLRNHGISLIVEKIHLIVSSVFLRICDNLSPILRKKIVLESHSIFENFNHKTDIESDEAFYNFLGVKTLIEYDTQQEEKYGIIARASGANAQFFPNTNSEDYYEYIDCLEAIYDAKDTFRMIELGAGYGRWICNGYFAVINKAIGPKIDVQLCGVEADLHRFQMMKQHLVNNDIPEDKYQLLQTAISEKEEFFLFPITDSFGTAIQVHYDTYSDSSQKKLEDLYNRGKIKVQIGDDKLLNTVVKAIPISDVIKKFDGLIDFLDMDIQGAEYDAVKGSITSINKNVKRMHIGTHSTRIEVQLIRLLKKNGWDIIRYYGFNKEVMGEFGPVIMADGIISCKNKRYY
jgi:FkbM family methyltransferase